MPERSGFYSTRRGDRGLSDRNDFVGSIARFYQRSYAGDYIGLALLLTAYILLQFFAEPFHRMFALDNESIQFPHAEIERVSVPWLFGYAGGIPLLVLILWAALIRPSGHAIHVTFLGFFISLILTSFLTDVIKNEVGRPRPDLIDRCKPAKGTPGNTLVTFSVCTEEDHHVLHDGWRSFPSGHSSFAFSGLGYLALFLSGQLHIFHPYHPRAATADLARFLVALLAPLLGALLIAISRCQDYRHDVWDVTTGSVLGLVVAWGTYRRYYPPLSAPPSSPSMGAAAWACDAPYPPLGVAALGERKERRGNAGNGYAGRSGEDGAGGADDGFDDDYGELAVDGERGARAEAVPLREMDRRRSDVAAMV